MATALEKSESFESWEETKIDMATALEKLESLRRVGRRRIDVATALESLESWEETKIDSGRRHVALGPKLR